MGLGIVLAALHLRRQPQGDAQHDAEKGQAEVLEDDAGSGDGGGENNGGHGEDASEDEGDGYDSLDDPGRRLHRLQSATDNTFFSNTVHRPEGDPQRAWYTKVKDYVFPPKESEAALEQFVPNYRWTPVISGVIIPFSLLLEIPGLTEHWYIRTEANAIVESKSNPAILEVGLAFSMACGLAANVCLVLRFLEKRVKTVTLLTIIFLTIHDIINIVTVIVFGVEHRFDDGFTYGQSFWMTVCSTVASTITNVTLITDFVRTPEFARSGSGLTRKQRALMIIVIVLLVYVAFGALVNSLIHGLNFIDGLYFTVVTIETIGFGDITPNSTGARIFICFYMAFGILNVGVAVAMTRETVLEGLELGYRKRLHNLQTRRREARRYRRWEARWLRAVEWRLKEAGQPVWVPDEHYSREGVRFVGLHGEKHGAGEIHWMKRWLMTLNLWDSSETRRYHVRGHPRGKHLNVDALEPQQLEAAALEAGVPLEMFLAQHGKRPDPDRRDSRLSSSSGARPPRGMIPFHHRHGSANNWPAHSQTPTHAQVGRMSAMLTKFAMGVTGTHIRMLGHAPEERVAEEVKEKNEGNAALDDDASTPTAQNQDETNPDGEDENQRRGPWADEQQQSKGLVQGDTLHPEVPSWTKDLAHGRNMKSDILYENYKEDMAAEEKKAYWVKLTVAWSLFLLFWTVGSAIFSATEGWSYGSAMYFCFLAFTTTGYGDFAPTTPAGRSVFVVWALFGVAAMTILIAVIEEVGSSRYKDALHSKTFDSAVKKFRERQNAETMRLTDKTTPRVPRMHSEGSLENALQAAQDAAQRELEGLPGYIIQQARTFHDHMHFFVNSGGGVAEEAAMEKKDGVPKELRELLDELAQVEDIGERAKQEILEGDDTRNTLLMLSIERSLRRLINAAEKSLGALAERDALLTMKEKNSRRQEGVEPSPSSSTLPDTPE